MIRNQGAVEGFMVGTFQANTQVFVDRVNREIPSYCDNHPEHCDPITPGGTKMLWHVDLDSMDYIENTAAHMDEHYFQSCFTNYDGNLPCKILNLETVTEDEIVHMLNSIGDVIHSLPMGPECEPGLVDRILDDTYNKGAPFNAYNLPSSCFNHNTFNGLLSKYSLFIDFDSIELKDEFMFEAIFYRISRKKKITINLDNVPIYLIATIFAILCRKWGLPAPRYVSFPNVSLLRREFTALSFDEETERIIREEREVLRELQQNYTGQLATACKQGTALPSQCDQVRGKGGGPIPVFEYTGITYIKCYTTATDCLSQNSYPSMTDERMLSESGLPGYDGQRRHAIGEYLRYFYQNNSLLYENGDFIHYFLQENFDINSTRHFNTITVQGGPPVLLYSKMNLGTIRGVSPVRRLLSADGSLQ